MNFTTATEEERRALLEPFIKKNYLQERKAERDERVSMGLDPAPLPETVSDTHYTCGDGFYCTGGHHDILGRLRTVRRTGRGPQAGQARREQVPSGLRVLPHGVPDQGIPEAPQAPQEEPSMNAQQLNEILQGRTVNKVEEGSTKGWMLLHFSKPEAEGRLFLTISVDEGHDNPYYSMCALHEEDAEHRGCVYNVREER
jgi:hypothetical protein